MEEPPDWALALIQWAFIAITCTSFAAAMDGFFW